VPGTIFQADAVVIGAGAVGLSVAYSLSSKKKNIIVIEKHPAFGQETSSHNSEVIHSGIYYPKGSLKARLCVEGRSLLYQFCEKYGINSRRTGKLIIAADDKEAAQLEKLFSVGKANGVSDIRLLSKESTAKLEPNIRAVAAIHSPSTGIFDSHQFMKCLESLSKDNGVIFAYNCEVVGISKDNGFYDLAVRDADGEKISVKSNVVVNSAGLYSDTIAQMVGIDIEDNKYKLYYCKGEYFRVRSAKAKLVNMLVYPPPEKDSLGVHTVMDLQGEMKLGPNAFYVDEVDYDVNPQHRDEFSVAAKTYFPFIESEDLSPDIAGIRPKLQAPGEDERDFVISDEKNKGFEGFINLIGIESPGLTSSLSIAKYVAGMI
jgi:L-2-hydroxyglutarate oxidase LhgO